MLRVSLEEAREPIEGDGYAVASLDGLGEGYGFRKIRSELGVTEFGVNAIVLPPGIETGPHCHERQQELYFVHSGRIEIEFGDGASHTLGPGGVARVDAPVERTIRNHGPDDAVYVIVGGEGGYVGRDGLLPEGEDGNPRPIAARLTAHTAYLTLRDRPAASVRQDHRRGPGSGRRIADRGGDGAGLGDAHHRRRLDQRRRARDPGGRARVARQARAAVLEQPANEVARALSPDPGDYRHHRGGEDNGDAHLKNLLVHHQVIVPVTEGRLDLGPWQAIFYLEFDGRRREAARDQGPGRMSHD